MRIRLHLRVGTRPNAGGILSCPSKDGSPSQPRSPVLVRRHKQRLRNGSHLATHVTHGLGHTRSRFSAFRPREPRTAHRAGRKRAHVTLALGMLHSPEPARTHGKLDCTSRPEPAGHAPGAAACRRRVQHRSARCPFPAGVRRDPGALPGPPEALGQGILKLQHGKASPPGSSSHPHGAILTPPLELGPSRVQRASVSQGPLLGARPSLRPPPEGALGCVPWESPFWARTGRLG